MDQKPVSLKPLPKWDGEDLVSRRQFLGLMGASLALAGAGACTPKPLEKVVPYVRQPENWVPGKPRFYASAFLLGGYATGILVESHLGRPTKIEGNPDHPASLGATDAFAQASILGLYDPDRSQVITQLGEIRTWQAFLAQVAEVGRAARALGGAGLRILTGNVTSPTLSRQLSELLRAMPAARWHVDEPGGREAIEEGAQLAFGERVETRYDLSQADVIVTLDSDLLGSGPGSVRYARDFASRRAAALAEGEGRPAMSRLYAIESMPTTTGTLADHRTALPAHHISHLARLLAAELRGSTFDPAGPGAALAAAIARDLSAHRGRSLVVAGESQPAAIHALVQSINSALGNFGTTVTHTEPVTARPPAGGGGSLAELTADMRDGKVDVLFILSGNPVYTAPADLDFASAMDRVKLRIHHGLYADETAERCHWHLPAAHDLEAWSDARAHDGTVTVLQPLIAPLYGGKSAHELVAAIAGAPEVTGLDLVRTTAREWLRGEGDFEAAWRRALHDGVVAGTASPRRSPAIRAQAIAEAQPKILANYISEKRGSSGEPLVELQLRLDPALHDGRFANNGWLQELPRPWTRLTWDNAALVGPKTAAALGVENEHLVTIRTPDGREVQAPIWILPGHAEDALTLHLGYGRRRAGQVGDGAGVDAYVLRTTANLWNIPGTRVTPAGGSHRLACTQTHHSMEGRNLARSGTLAAFTADPHFATHAAGHGPAAGHEPISLYPGFPPDENAWGMVVDLGACTGCNACVVACQAENNIPVVGKDQVLNGREMHWMRIDRYFTGASDSPDIEQQPVMCMHCEQAPCEVVCPVAATTHSTEGLNEMTYNRCVGTRYCANNCPYKVRRFNFYKYADVEAPVLELLQNPDVTVRARGVMEKCSYCVQRINHARIAAGRESRPIRDGEVTTACQQACPTQAIMFGNLADPASRVTRWRSDPRNYGILTELGTRPRTTYLAKVRNPNPDLQSPGAAPVHG